MQKGFESVQAGIASVCVMLLPARTDTKWFHSYVYNKAEIRFVKGRLKFGNSKNSAPFPSGIIVFSNNNLNIDQINVLYSLGYTIVNNNKIKILQY